MVDVHEEEASNVPSRSKCGMHGTWRGESGDTPEINLGGSACYGNPGCHGGPIGKYKKGTKKERGIGLDRKEGACKGVEGVMNDEELG